MAKNLISDSKTAKRFGIHPKTLPRWDKKPELGFPKPIWINGRKYRDEAELDEFCLRAAVTGAAGIVKTTLA